MLDLNRFAQRTVTASSLLALLAGCSNTDVDVKATSKGVPLGGGIHIPQSSGPTDPGPSDDEQTIVINEGNDQQQAAQVANGPVDDMDHVDNAPGSVATAGDCAPSTDYIYEKYLYPNCRACHSDSSTTFTYLDKWSSLSTAEKATIRSSLQPHISWGSASTSELYKLLLGEGTGDYTTMPTTGRVFDDDSVALAEIEEWIDGWSDWGSAAHGCSDDDNDDTTIVAYGPWVTDSIVDRNDGIIDGFGNLNPCRPTQQQITYHNTVKPFLDNYCVRCHSPEYANDEGTTASVNHDGYTAHPVPIDQGGSEYFLHTYDGASTLSWTGYEGVMPPESIEAPSDADWDRVQSWATNGKDEGTLPPTVRIVDVERSTQITGKSGGMFKTAPTAPTSSTLSPGTIYNGGLGGSKTGPTSTFSSPGVALWSEFTVDYEAREPDGGYITLYLCVDTDQEDYNGDLITGWSYSNASMDTTHMERNVTFASTDIGPGSYYLYMCATDGETGFCDYWDDEITISN